jgi:hypothetical protein
MTYRLTTLERAFQLARSGDCAGVADIRARLLAEGYDRKQLEGPALTRQLRTLCAEAQKGEAG